ncbi:LPXTG cell wall anchor domain-containing protein [Glycomyces albidus]|uniref:LPXTG cell wall anchor domain-containing protein n=1 Tax=Glycomyces albidus TaxID=2656774 RepID=UPI00128FE949|nr:LPXTG cell wall anchor domain-containing protein [Glycomyces albidus]
MELKQSIKTVGAFGVTAAAGLLGSIALASPAQAAVATIPINDGNVPTTAAEFGDQSCDQVPDDIAATEDGWVFVLPAAAGAEGNFISVTATFEDAEGDEHVLTTDEDGGIVSGSGDNKAYIITPAGWTLVDAEAEVNDPDEGAQFNLTHTCPGEPGEEPSSPGEEPSSPSEEPTSPGDGSSQPGEETTSPTAGGQLPTTGTPLTIAIVSAAALAAGGAALYLIQRRRREAQNW